MMNHQITWNKCAAIIFICMVASIALNLKMPFWLAPPDLFYTPILYHIIALLWLPVLVGCSFIRPQGNKIGILLIGSVGFFPALYLLIALAFNLAQMRNPAFEQLNYCEQLSLIENNIRYECTFAGSSDGPYVVTFEGLIGSPVVQVVIE